MAKDAASVPRTEEGLQVLLERLADARADGDDYPPQPPPHPLPPLQPELPHPPLLPLQEPEEYPEYCVARRLVMSLWSANGTTARPNRPMASVASGMLGCMALAAFRRLARSSRCRRSTASPRRVRRGGLMANAAATPTVRHDRAN